MQYTCCSPIHQEFLVQWVGKVYVNEVVAGFLWLLHFIIAQLRPYFVPLFLTLMVARYFDA